MTSEKILLKMTNLQKKHYIPSKAWKITQNGTEQKKLKTEKRFPSDYEKYDDDKGMAKNGK